MKSLLNRVPGLTSYNMSRVAGYRMLFLLAIHFLHTAEGFGQLNSPAIELLKRSGSYEHTEDPNFPVFTYQSVNSKELRGIRNAYRLDSVAGTGSDVERAIRLLEWFHNEVPHEDEVNLEVLNAPHIIDTYRNRKISQGCYPLAIAMNEIFLSMGYKSRTVICFSGVYNNLNGGHTINAVYIESLKKWVYMDPQDNLYVMDEKGNLLSIMEVRERLISGKTLLINPGANYHNESQNVKAYFEEFMGEHMFRFICPLNSAFDSETRASGRTLYYVELLPLNSGTPPVDKFETSMRKGVNVVNYHTSNELLFWAAP